MRGLAQILAVATVAGLALLPRTGGAAGEADRTLVELLRSPVLRGARVGLLVADLDTGETLLERSSRELFVPASNQKLLTAAAALLHWGPTHRFETRVLAERALDAEGVLAGRLWIVGSGDPSLVSESIWKLAEDLRLLGLLDIRGGLGVDATLFDARHTHPDWEPLSSNAYHARVAAFAVNYSSFRVEVMPGRGRAAKVSLAPDVSYFRLLGGVTTAPGRAPLELALEPLPDRSGELVRLRGAIARDAEPKTFWRAVSLPELYAVAVLRRQLEAHGIRPGAGLALGPVPTDARELLRFSGAPISEIVRKLNKWSNNFIGEQLLKSLGAERSGRPGSWENGPRAIYELLREHDLIDRATVIADGSGLSPRNRLSPDSLVRVIRALARDFRVGPEFLASLPLGGLDGTLEERMVDGAPALRGKTGHLRHVASLSGVVRGASGRRLAFSLLVNGAAAAQADLDLAMDGFISQLAGLDWNREAAQGVSGD